MTVWDLIKQLQEISWGDMQMKVNVWYRWDHREWDTFCKFDIGIVDWAVPIQGDYYARVWCSNPEVFIYFDQDAHQTDNEVK